MLRCLIYLHWWGISWWHQTCWHLLCRCLPCPQWCRRLGTLRLGLRCRSGLGWLHSGWLCCSKTIATFCLCCTLGSASSLSDPPLVNAKDWLGQWHRRFALRARTAQRGSPSWRVPGLFGSRLTAPGECRWAALGFPQCSPLLHFLGCEGPWSLAHSCWPPCPRRSLSRWRCCTSRQLSGWTTPLRALRC